jgi:hypothetical protein
MKGISILLLTFFLELSRNGKVAKLMALQEASISEFAVMSVVMAYLSTNVTKNVINNMTELNRDLFSGTVFSVNNAMHTGKPNPNDTLIKREKTIVLKNVVICRNTGMIEDAMPNSVHDKMKNLLLPNLPTKKAPKKIAITASQKLKVYNINLSVRVDAVASIICVKMADA